MAGILVWLVLFCLTTAGSIVLLGDRRLISGDLFTQESLLRLATAPKLYFALFLAFVSRLSFICINNGLLSSDRLRDSSTTVTAFATALSFIVIVIANNFFLGESLAPRQIAGASLAILGILLMVS
ncbi:MAG: hypothetical protein ACE5GX_00010 [Thermoanaerobaculia bacterium]